MALTKVSGDILDTGIVVAGVTTSTNFKTGTSNLHSSGIEIAGINVLGADTPIGAGVTIYNSGGADFTGVVTATKFVGQADISGGSITATTGTFSGDVSIGGTLTYQDVTNIDSVGLGTFRNGINVTAGVSTFAAAIDANGGANIAGGLVVNSAKISDLTDNRVVIAGTNGELEDSANLTYDGATLNVKGGSTDTPLIVDTTSTNGSHMRFQKDAGNKHFVGSGGGFGLGDIDDLAFRTVDNLIFGVGTSEKLRITSAGQILVGTDSVGGPYDGVTPDFVSEKNSNYHAYTLVVNANHAGQSGILQFVKSRGTSDGANTIVQDDDRVGSIYGIGADGTNRDSAAAAIDFRVDGTVAANRMPGRIEFRTTSDSAGAVVPTERLRITSAGNLKLPDSAKIELGGAQDVAGDLQIHHTSNNSFIKNTTGQLQVQTDNFGITNESASAYNLYTYPNAQINLYYAGSVKFATSSTGVTVTGEVAATQDYPNYRPTLDFNFAAVKKLDPRIKYYRSGPASYVDEFGKLVLVGENAPRFDHDPATRESKGLLIEESRKNYLENGDFVSSYGSGNSWSYGHGSDVYSASSGSQLSTNPDGTSPAYHYAPSSTAAHHRFNRTVTLDAYNTSYVASVFVKRVTAGSVSNLNRYLEIELSGDFATNGAPTGHSGSHGMSSVTFDLQNVTSQYAGNSAVKASGLVGDPKIEDYGNGWYRCSYVFNPGTNDGSSSLTGHIWFGHPNSGAGDTGNETGNGNPSFYLWGAMVEKGASLTSYVPNHGAYQITRGADLAYIDGQDFTDAYNVPEGTFILNGSNDDFSTTNQGMWGVEKSTNRSGFFTMLGYRVGGGNNAGDIGAWYNNNGSTSAFHNMAVASTGVTVGIPYKTAFAYKINDMSSTTNGITVQTDTSASIASAGEFDRFTLGGYHYDTMSTGHIQRVMYYRQRLNNAQLKNITS